MNKLQTVKRLVKNRLRFPNSRYIAKFSNNIVLIELDPTCLCGLKVGDKFKGKLFAYQVVELMDTIMLLAYRKA